jgi:rhodanese-related sulfurtransferase
MFNFFGSSSANGRVDGSAVSKLVQERNALLLDVRTPDEFGGGSKPGARNVPVQELAQRLGELPKDRPIVVFCRSGGRSASARATLTQAGFEVYDAGGIGSF